MKLESANAALLRNYLLLNEMNFLPSQFPGSLRRSSFWKGTEWRLLGFSSLYSCFWLNVSTVRKLLLTFVFCVLIRSRWMVQYLLDEVALVPEKLEKIPLQVYFHNMPCPFIRLMHHFSIYSEIPFPISAHYLLLRFLGPTRLVSFTFQVSLLLWLWWVRVSLTCFVSSLDFLIIRRLHYFFHAVERLQIFLSHFPVFPNAFLVGGPADLFVIELTDQVVLLH